MTMMAFSTVLQVNVSGMSIAVDSEQFTWAMILVIQLVDEHYGTDSRDDMIEVLGFAPYGFVLYS